MNPHLKDPVLGFEHSGTPRLTPEFKEKVFCQINKLGFSVTEVSYRIGISAHRRYKLPLAIKPDNSYQHARDLQKAKNEILKKGAQYFAREPD